MAALVLRIKFPETYPLIYKTLRVDANLTVQQSVAYIADTVNVTTLLNGHEGLYDPTQQKFLDDGTPLSEYEFLQDVEYVEFKDKNAPVLDQNHNQNNDPQPCCVIL